MPKHTAPQLIVGRSAALDAILEDLGLPSNAFDPMYQKAKETLDKVIGYAYEKGKRDAHDIQVRELNEAYARTMKELGL